MRAPELSNGPMPRTLAEAAKRFPTCSVCGKKSAYFGLFVPTKTFADKLGVKNGQAVAYGACKKHMGDHEAIEQKMLKDASHRNN